MEQCLHCANQLFFKPLDSETYTCCSGWGETAGDINLRTGVSPKIQIHGMEDKPCEKFKFGASICRTDQKPEDSFWLHPVRKEGEEFLLKLLSNQYQI